MAQLITPGPYGDTPVVVADKTRALPANQGLNDTATFALIKTEIQSAITANTLINNYNYAGSGTTAGLI